MSVKNYGGIYTTLTNNLPLDHMKYKQITATKKLMIMVNLNGHTASLLSRLVNDPTRSNMEAAIRMYGVP